MSDKYLQLCGHKTDHGRSALSANPGEEGESGLCKSAGHGLLRAGVGAVRNHSVHQQRKPHFSRKMRHGKDTSGNWDRGDDASAEAGPADLPAGREGGFYRKAL